MRIDLHTHSTLSDGTDSPSELVYLALNAGLDVVALSDHDTFAGLDEAAKTAHTIGIGFVPAIELSCTWRGETVHLLGYYLDPTERRLTSELEKICDLRKARIAQIVARFNTLGIAITTAEVFAQGQSGRTVGRPHVADALVARGLLPDRRAGFERYLAKGRPCYVPRYNTDLPKMIKMVRDAHGVSVIAHARASGRGIKISDDDLTYLVTHHGLDGIEVDHQDHDASTKEKLSGLAKDLGVIITGGSDYHGTGKKNHELGCNTTTLAMLEAISALAKARIELDSTGEH